MTFASTGTYTLAIPAASTWIGVTFAFQGFRLDNVGGALSIVPLNALELVLGQ